jgi:hypothetical protein
MGSLVSSMCCDEVISFALKTLHIYTRLLSNALVSKSTLKSLPLKTLGLFAQGGGTRW